MVLSTGTAAPAFRLPASTGTPTSLDDLLAGGPAVLCFFKTTCPTCALTLPVVGDLQRRFGSRVPVVAVSQNGLDVARPWLEERGFDGPVLDDEVSRFAVSRAYALRAVPATVLVASGGKVLDSFEGWSRDRYNRLASQLAGFTGLDPGPVSTPADGRPPQKPG